jgi:hypothetical protein
MRSKFHVRVGAVLVAGTLLLSACAKTSTTTGSGGLTNVGSGAPSLSPTPGESTMAATTPPTGTTTTTAANPPATATKTKVVAPTTKKVVSPEITSFVIAQKPQCPVVPTSDAPFSKPGTDIILKWKTTGGVTQVALSLDDPGFFKKFGTGSISEDPASGQVDLSFQCDPTVQPDTTHTYTLDTIGGTKSVEKTLTVTVQTSP